MSDSVLRSSDPVRQIAAEAGLSDDLVVVKASPDLPEESGRPDGVAAERRAVAAQQAQRWDAALAAWREAVAAEPSNPAFHAAVLAMLLILDRRVEAAELADAYVAKFPHSIDVIAQQLNIRMACGDWMGAAAGLGGLQRAFADHPYVSSSAARIAARIDAGLAGIDRHVLVGQCARAEAAGEAHAASRGWASLLDRDADDRLALLGCGRALRAAGDLPQADRVLTQAFGRYSPDLEIAAHYAEVAADRGDAQEAARRWHDVLEREPQPGPFLGVAATRFGAVGHFEAAEAALDRAIEAEPARADLYMLRAHLAHDSERWDLAVERWDVVHRLLPDDPNVLNARGNAIWQAAAMRLEGAETSAAPRGDQAKAQAPASAVQAGQPLTDKELALAFEGLGDHCEFGILQRRMGAEPIGLFRFAAVSAATLTKLLQTHLQALGDPGYLELGLTAHNEYMLRDNRGLYHMHCFVLKGSVDEARFLRQQTTRLGFLKRKLIEDLEAGEKIFVHKSSHDALSDEEAIALHDATLRYGPNAVLVIRCAAEPARAGTVEIIRPGLLVGYVATPYGDSSGAIDEAAWRGILPQAHARVQAWRRAGEGEPPPARHDARPDSRSEDKPAARSDVPPEAPRSGAPPGDKPVARSGDKPGAKPGARNRSR